MVLMTFSPPPAHRALTIPSLPALFVPIFLVKLMTFSVSGRTADLLALPAQILAAHELPDKRPALPARKPLPTQEPPDALSPDHASDADGGDDLPHALPSQ
ncbi:MAG: hypothetical protein K1W23_17865 [Lachnospiraceae bacterium]